MPFESLNLGLTLTLPTNGTENWGTTIKNTTWTKISSHDHSGSGNGNQISTTGIADNSVTTSKIVDVNVTSEKLAPNIALTLAPTLSPAGTSQDLDLDNGNIQQLDLGAASGDVTVTISNPKEGGEYTIYIIQSATARTITWPASFQWPQGQEIILSTTNDAVDYVKVQYIGANFRVLGWDLDIQ